MSALILTIPFCACQKERNEANSNLMDVVLNAKNSAEGYFSSLEDNGIQTKALGESEVCATTLSIPEWASPYVNNYMEQDEVQNWNAETTCRLLEKNTDLQDEQKKYVAEIIGVLDYLKDESLRVTLDNGRMSMDDCLAVYKNAVKEILISDITVGGVGGGAIGGGLGVGFGIIGGLVTAWREIKQAGRDYVRCCA